MFGVKIDGGWNANNEEFEKDTKKEYDWIYLVDSMGYTKFSKKENIVDKVKNEFMNTGFKPFIAFNEIDKKEVLVLGEDNSRTWDGKIKYVVSCGNLITWGIHSDYIVKSE